MNLFGHKRPEKPTHLTLEELALLLGTKLTVQQLLAITGKDSNAYKVDPDRVAELNCHARHFIAAATALLAAQGVTAP